MEQTDNGMLDYWLLTSVCEPRQEHGIEYLSTTVLSYWWGIQSQRKLKSAKDINFLENVAFLHLRQVLDGEIKRPTQKGLGVVVRQVEPLSAEQVRKLWDTKQLEGHNAKVLVRTMLFRNGLTSGLEEAKNTVV